MNDDLIEITCLGDVERRFVERSTGRVTVVGNTRPPPATPRPMAPPPPPAIRAPRLDKCPSCGSREWIEHDGRERCAYCRSEREGHPAKPQRPLGPIPPPPEPPPTRTIFGRFRFTNSTGPK